MKKVISDDQLANLTKLKASNPLLALLSQLSGVRKLNKFYAGTGNTSGEEFLKQVIDSLQTEIDFIESELIERIPDKGPFILISNHPFGALDGIVMLHLILRKRPDFRVMANFLLQNIPEINHLFISVNPFEDHKSAFSNIKGLKDALAYVEKGHPIGIFPAGEVSSFQTHMRTVSDRKWQNSALKFIRKANVPVVPLHFDGSNSFVFHFLGLIHPVLRTVVLPSEFMKQKGKTIKVRIGQPISPKELQTFESLETFGRYLRAKTYALGSGAEVNKRFFRLPVIQKTQEPIAEPSNSELIKKEIAELEGEKLFSQDSFTCYLTTSSAIKETLREIGRLREITFREAGEGSGHSLDLDEFDFSYKHLILWDFKENKIVGCYRIGMGAELMERYGQKGFYTSSLFKMDKEMFPVLEQSIELGRSFIVKEYQRHRLSLFLLWKGILHCLISNPQYRYVIGPVSISANYSTFSRGLIMEFVRKFYFHPTLSEFVKPRKPFKMKSKQVDMDALISASDADLKKLDKLISDIEPEYFAVPVLLKKYLQQNARILAFNRDPKFADALDGLMLLDLHELPEETVQNLKKEFMSSER